MITNISCGNALILLDWPHCSKHCTKNKEVDKLKIDVWQRKGNQIFMQAIISPQTQMACIVHILTIV